MDAPDIEAEIFKDLVELSGLFRRKTLSATKKKALSYEGALMFYPEELRARRNRFAA
jgi:hypothetical protein